MASAAASDEDLEGDDCVNPTQLFRRMISTEMSKGEDEWKARRGPKRRKPSRKSTASSAEEPTFDIDNEGGDCASDTSESDEFFSAEEEFVSGDEVDGSLFDIDDMSSVTSDLQTLRVDLPRASSARHRSRRQRKRDRQQLRQGMRDALEDLPLYDDGTVVSVAKHSSHQYAIDVLDDAQVAATEASPSVPVIGVPSLVECCLRVIWMRTPNSGLAPGQSRKVSMPQDLPFQLKVQASQIRSCRRFKQLTVRWLVSTLDAAEKQRPSHSVDAPAWTDHVLLPEHGFMKPMTVSSDWKKEKKTSPVYLASRYKYDPGWFSFTFLSTRHRWKGEMASILPNDNTTQEEMICSGGTVVLRKEKTMFVGNLAQLIDICLPASCPTGPLARVDGKYSAVVWQVRSSMFSRFPFMSHVAFDIALAYVWWSRGLVEAAVAQLLRLSKRAIEGSMKSFYLNEIGRLYWHLQDHAAAGRFFRLAADSIPPMADPVMHMQGTALALTATMCDCGLFTYLSGRTAHRAWKSALTCPRFFVDITHSTVQMPTPVFMNAVESLLFVHAGKPFNDEPMARDGACALWLRRVAEWMESLTRRHRWLSYHLSLVLALLQLPEQSEWAYTDFLPITMTDVWESFNELVTPRPPNAVSTGLHPWGELMELWPVSGVPFIQLRWRTMLGYPCFTGRQTSRHTLTSEEAEELNIRQYDSHRITADVSMELPPLRPVVLDMFDGSISLNTNGSLCPVAWKARESEHLDGGAHFQQHSEVINVSGGPSVVLHRHVLDTPLRESAVLELTNAMGCCGKSFHLDLGKTVRNFLYKTIRRRISEELEMEKAKAALKVLHFFEVRGEYCVYEDVCGGNTPDRHRFSLLKYEVVDIFTFGAASICIVFLAQRYRRSCDMYSRMAQTRNLVENVLMVVDARSVGSFLSPTIHARPPSDVPHPPRYEYRTSSLAVSVANRVGIHHVMSRYLLLTVTWMCQKPVSQPVTIHEDGHMTMNTFNSMDFPAPGFFLDTCVVILERRSSGMWLAKFDMERDCKRVDVMKVSEDEQPHGHSGAAIQVDDVVILQRQRRSVYLCDVNKMAVVKMVDTEDEAVAMCSDFKENTEISDASLPRHGDHVGTDPPHQQMEEIQSGHFQGKMFVSIDDGYPDYEDEVENGRPLFSGETGEIVLLTKSPRTDLRVEGRRVGSSRDVVFALDYRLLWIRVYKRHGGSAVARIVLSQQLSGFPVEACCLPAGKGLLVTATRFKGRSLDGFCREELYWFSEAGGLCGFLPFLGSGPHSFYPVLGQAAPTRRAAAGAPVAAEQQKAERQLDGLHVYFSDGHGALACARLE